MAEEEFKQHAKNIRFIVSCGTEDIERDLETMAEEVKAALEGVVKRVTEMSGYYIIDGEVCLPADYDKETKRRKPGTFPPSWAGGPSDSEVRKAKQEEEKRKAVLESSKKASSELAKEASKVVSATPDPEEAGEKAVETQKAKRKKRTNV